MLVMYQTRITKSKYVFMFDIKPKEDNCHPIVLMDSILTWIVPIYSILTGIV